MSSLFDSLINAQLDGTRFSFYSDKEIESISVKEISNPMAYDELGNPTLGGICDEALGVSALDKLSVCKTCGCDSMYCPGHLGHIKLISTCYNPFTIKLLYKLIKSKCMSCHRMRIYPKKTELFEIRLQLIKLGYIVEAAKLGEYSEFGMDSVESVLRILRKKLNLKSKSKEDEKEGEMTTELKDETLTALERISELEKENREIFFAQITSILEENKPTDSRSSAVTIAFRKLEKEIMNSVIPSRCPHCECRNPRIKKKGAVKFFQLPLSLKDQKTMKSMNQRIDMKIDMSTIGAISDYEEGEDDDSKSDEPTQRETEDPSEKKKQIYLNPLEIKEHAKRLWDVESALLEPIFGSWGIFFMNYILVTPNRFRPETSGGNKGGDDREYLHAHSAMITTILKANQTLRKTIESKEKLGEEFKDHHDLISERSKAQSTDVGREYTSQDVIRYWVDLQEAIN